MTMPRTASPKTRMLSFQQLDSIMARRSQPYAVAGATRPRMRARLYGNYFVTHRFGSSSFTIRYFSAKGEVYSYNSVEVAAGPDGSSLYLLPVTTRGCVLRPSDSRSRKRWLEDKYLWTPYRWGDELTSNWQASYLVRPDGTSEQISLARTHALTYAVTPPSMRLSHAKWVVLHPDRLLARRSFSSAARAFTSAIVRALKETAMPFSVDRAGTLPAELIVAIPPTMQRRQELLRLQLTDFDHTIRKQLGVSVEWAAKHYCVRALIDGGFRYTEWPSPAHAVRGVTEWFLARSLYIPGPTLC